MSCEGCVLTRDGAIFVGLLVEIDGASSSLENAVYLGRYCTYEDFANVVQEYKLAPDNLMSQPSGDPIFFRCLEVHDATLTASLSAKAREAYVEHVRKHLPERTAK